MRLLYMAIIAATIIFTTGCGGDELELISIDTYIEQNNLEVQETASGLKYIIEETGGAEKPTVFSEITIKYRGYRTDDFIFDSSESFTSPLETLIPGWVEGIPLFGRGGKGTLFIPSGLAYGEQGAGNDIPPNADIIFDIELLNF